MNKVCKLGPSVNTVFVVNFPIFLTRCLFLGNTGFRGKGTQHLQLAMIWLRKKTVYVCVCVCMCTLVCVSKEKAEG